MYEVIICGGGPVGMALAIELGQRGIRTLVIERYLRPQAVPKGQNLTQRTLEHFRSWNCESELRSARTIPAGHGIGGITAYGSLLGEYWYDWLQRDLVREYYATDNERLPQYATEEVLRSRVAKLPNVDVRYGMVVDRVEQDANRVLVTASPTDGACEPITFAASYAVGCDGSRSVTRMQAGMTQTLSDHDRVMTLLVFRSAELTRLLERFPGKAFYNVLRPELDGYWLFFGRVGLNNRWFFHAPVPRDAIDGNFDFKAYLETAIGAPINLEIEYTGFWDLRFAVADEYRADRIFVAGDAAHSHPPYGGYGINTGFEDARNLGWKIAATLRGWGSNELLTSYHHERHGVFISTARDFIARAIDEDRKFLSSFDPERDRAAFRTAWQARGELARTEVLAFEPNYEGSPVVPGTSGPGGSALGRHRLTAMGGHHLAPAPLPSGDLWDRLGNDFTLIDLGNGAAASAFAAAASKRNIPLTVVAAEDSALRERYGTTLILVRPDAFVAWAGHEVTDPDRVLALSAGQPTQPNDCS